MRPSPWPGSRRSLSARGQFLKAFAGIVYCLAFSLLALGGYSMEEQFANPLDAHSAALLFSAVLIATGVTLLYLLLHPSRPMAHTIAPWSAVFSWEDESGSVKSAARSADNEKAIPLHARYVDPVLVRIRR